MERIEIIDAVGRKYATSNIENGEFSYPKAFKEKNPEFEPIRRLRRTISSRRSMTTSLIW